MSEANSAESGSNSGGISRTGAVEWLLCEMACDEPGVESGLLHDCILLDTSFVSTSVSEPRQRGRAASSSAADHARGEALPLPPPPLTLPAEEAAGRRRCGGATDADLAHPDPEPRPPRRASSLPLSPPEAPDVGGGGGVEAPPVPRPTKRGLVRVALAAKSSRGLLPQGAGATLRDRRGQGAAGGGCLCACAGRSAEPWRARRVVDLNADDAISRRRRAWGLDLEIGRAHV